MARTDPVSSGQSSWTRRAGLCAVSLLVCGWYVAPVVNYRHLSTALYWGDVRLNTWALAWNHRVLAAAGVALALLELRPVAYELPPPEPSPISPPTITSPGSRGRPSPRYQSPGMVRCRGTTQTTSGTARGPGFPS